MAKGYLSRSARAVHRSCSLLRPGSLNRSLTCHAPSRLSRGARQDGIAAALSSRCRHWERSQQPCPRYRSLSACTDVEDVAVCGARGELSPADNATRRIMKRFKSARQAQRFLSVHDQVANLFHVPTPESIPARGANEIHRWRPSELSPGCAAALYLRSRRPGLTCRRFRIARGRRSKHRVGPQNLEKSQGLACPMRTQASP